MDRLGKSLLGSALGILLAGTVVAQQDLLPQPSLPAWFNTPLHQHPNVRQSLGLTQQQFNQLDAANRQLQTRFREQAGRLSNLTDRQRSAQARDLMQLYHLELARASGQILTAAQQRRYRQLDLQYRGMDSFTDADVQHQLELTPAQLQGLRELDAQSQRELQEIQRLGQVNRDEAQRRYEAWRMQTWHRTNTILNDAQRRAWAGMTGEPYIFPLDFGGPNR
jgi:hypothetical protein